MLENQLLNLNEHANHQGILLKMQILKSRSVRGLGPCISGLLSSDSILLVHTLNSESETGLGKAWLRGQMLFLKKIFLAASGLSCGTWDLRCGPRDFSLWHAGFSLAVACRFFLSRCGVQAPGHVGSVVCSTRAL